MIIKRIIPVLLIDNKGLVKTVKFRNPRYCGDPINAVKIFNEKEVDELILLDIKATAEKRRPDFVFLKDIVSEAFMPIAYGGGISCLEDIKNLMEIGIEKFVINTSAYKEPNFLRVVADFSGNQSVVAGIDVKRNLLGSYDIYINNGRKKCQAKFLEYTKKLESIGIGELFINSIDRDGSMAGYDIPLVESIAKSHSIPVIACGGAGCIEDLSLVINEGGASAAAAGSLFIFYGKMRSVLINYPSHEEIDSLDRR